MGMPERTRERRLTLGDCLDLPEGSRWELIEGVLYDMAPAPSRLHQEIVVELTRQLANLLAGHRCRVFVAPFDVRLPEGDEPDEAVVTVVQPDVLVVCDQAKLDERGCRGAPDFIIEVTSPNSSSRDQILKSSLYERAGVREYWIVHPHDRLVVMRLLGPDGRFAPPVYRELRGRAAVAALDGQELDLDSLPGA